MMKKLTAGDNAAGEAQKAIVKTQKQDSSKAFKPLA